MQSQVSVLFSISTRMLYRGIVVILISASLSFVRLCAVENETTTALLVSSVEAREKDLLAVLQNEPFWKAAVDDRDKAKSIACVVYAVNRLRSVSAVPYLVKHLSFISDPNPIGRISDDRLCPVVPALVSIGLPAVPALIELLKQEGVPQEDRERAVVALLGIYDQGGYGKDLLRIRLSIELEKASKEKGALIRQALDSPELAPEPRSASIQTGTTQENAASPIADTVVPVAAPEKASPVTPKETPHEGKLSIEAPKSK